MAWNAYGLSIAQEMWSDPAYLYTEESFNALVGPAALAIEADPIDHDGDGVASLEELMLGTAPGNANSYYAAPFAP